MQSPSNPNSIIPEMSEKYRVSGDGPPSGTSRQALSEAQAAEPRLTGFVVTKNRLVLTLKHGPEDTPLVWVADISDSPHILVGLGLELAAEALNQDPVGTLTHLLKEAENKR